MKQASKQLVRAFLQRKAEEQQAIIDKAPVLSKRYGKAVDALEEIQELLAEVADAPRAKPLHPSFEQSGKFSGVIMQNLGSSTAPCLGYWGIYQVTHRKENGDAAAWSNVSIPGLDVYTEMGDDAEIEIAWTFRVVKRGKVPTKKCMNPWPAHVHDDEKIRRRKERDRREARKEHRR